MFEFNGYLFPGFAQDYTFERINGWVWGTNTRTGDFFRGVKKTPSLVPRLEEITRIHEQEEQEWAVKKEKLEDITDDSLDATEDDDEFKDRMRELMNASNVLRRFVWRRQNGRLRRHYE